MHHHNNNNYNQFNNQGLQYNLLPIYKDKEKDKEKEKEKVQVDS